MSSVDQDFADFVAQSSPRLVTIARLMCGDRHLAEDLVQGALARCYLKWSRITRSDEPFAYVRQSVVNAYLSRLRTRPWLERSMADTDDRPLSDGTAQVDVRIVLHKALATLSPRQRAIVVLRYFEDLTERETAAELGISVGTVKSTAHQALARMRIDPDIGDLVIARPASGEGDLS
jgi:RNA polymerase sigma-70 factor (sigma-E family)